MRQTRVAIGVPVLNGADHLDEALDTFLGQSYRDFGLVVVDNASTDVTPDIVRRYTRRDPRVRSRRNPKTVGQVENFRRAFRAAIEEFENVEYFAWGSHEDLWHPLWLESMIDELDADPAAVVAFPLWAAIREDGSRIPQKPSKQWAHARWDTAGLTDPVERAARVGPGRRVPNVINGLFRAEALERSGVLHTVFATDRLLMSQLALLGTFRQVPRELWMRRTRANPLPGGWARLFDAGRRPLYLHLPTEVVHAGVMLWWAVLKGRARPEAGRAQGMRVVAAHLKSAWLRLKPRRRRRG